MFQTLYGGWNRQYVFNCSDQNLPAPECSILFDFTNSVIGQVDSTAPHVHMFQTYEPEHLSAGRKVVHSPGTNLYTL